MRKVGTVLNVISETPDKQKVEETIDYANPRADESDLGAFVKGFNNLSQNKLKGVQRIYTDNLIFPPDEDD